MQKHRNIDEELESEDWLQGFVVKLAFTLLRKYGRSLRQMVINKMADKPASCCDFL